MNDEVRTMNDEHSSLITHHSSFGLATVTYDRSDRVYIVANGRELGRFDCGPENRVKADWLALQYNDLYLCEIAREMVSQGHDEGRVIRAAAVILEGRILSHERTTGYSRATIKASTGVSKLTGWDRYQVVHNLIWTCDCPDYEQHDGHGYRCKHTITIEMLERKQDLMRQELSQVAARKLEDWTAAYAARRTASQAQPCAICGGPAGALSDLCQGCQNAVDAPDIVLDLADYTDEIPF